MTEEEWRETDTAKAVAAFMALELSVLINVLGGEVGGFVTRIFTSGAKGNIEQQIEEAGLPLFLKGFVDPDRDDALRGGMYLIAALSALEACVEEITKAALKADQTLITGKPFEKLKIPASVGFAPEDEKIESLYTVIDESVGLKAGINRYEGVLKFVNLDGRVPDIIGEHLYAAQLIRNVWAHSAGKADAKFVAKAPHLRWEQGDLVKLKLDEVQGYLTAVILYGTIIANRHRAGFGLPPASIGEKAKDHDLNRAYREMYDPPE